jgi:Xylose isomerase-like TIM barrel
LVTLCVDDQMMLIVYGSERERPTTSARLPLEEGVFTTIVVPNTNQTYAIGVNNSGEIASRGALYLMLQNRTYRGEIVHKGKSHPGDHTPVIDPPLWEAVQAQLAANTVACNSGTRTRQPSLLAGILFDGDGNRMTPSHVVKNVLRYRLACAGIDPANIAWRHRLRINHVHCKDVRPGMLTRARAADQSFLDAVLDGVFTVPGDGVIDFGAVFIALKAADYRGWLVVEAEQDPAKAPPLVYARRGFAYLSAALRDMGW